eukprot:364968-Chlamydomonas_euryale.AAC.14
MLNEFDAGYGLSVVWQCLWQQDLNGCRLIGRARTARFERTLCSARTSTKQTQRRSTPDLSLTTQPVARLPPPSLPSYLCRAGQRSWAWSIRSTACPACKVLTPLSHRTLTTLPPPLAGPADGAHEPGQHGPAGGAHEPGQHGQRRVQHEGPPHSPTAHRQPSPPPLAGPAGGAHEPGQCGQRHVQHEGHGLGRRNGRRAGVSGRGRRMVVVKAPTRRAGHTHHTGEQQSARVFVRMRTNVGRHVHHAHGQQTRACTCVRSRTDNVRWYAHGALGRQSARVRAHAFVRVRTMSGGMLITHLGGGALVRTRTFVSYRADARPKPCRSHSSTRCAAASTPVAARNARQQTPPPVLQASVDRLPQLYTQCSGFHTRNCKKRPPPYAPSRIAGIGGPLAAALRAVQQLARAVECGTLFGPGAGGRRQRGAESAEPGAH